MKSFTDQMGRIVQLAATPERIISLVPSQSELLWDLGLGENLVGITKFCIHPNEMFRSITRIGGTKNLQLDQIKELKPDLIIGNKEENVKEQIEELEKEFPVWMSDVNSFEDALDMIAKIGEITGKKEKAVYLSEEIRIGFSNLPVSQKKVIYFIWKDPWYVAGKNTFIDNMLQKAGFTNCIKESRYPEITMDQLAQLEPDLIFLSTEPYPFKDSDIEPIQKIISGKVLLVDGEMFSWYGSRLRMAPDYLRSLHHN